MEGVLGCWGVLCLWGGDNGMCLHKNAQAGTGRVSAPSSTAATKTQDLDVLGLKPQEKGTNSFALGSPQIPHLYLSYLWAAGENGHVPLLVTLTDTQLVRLD
jgi:hypothetical protein